MASLRSSFAKPKWDVLIDLDDNEFNRLTYQIQIFIKTLEGKEQIEVQSWFRMLFDTKRVFIRVRENVGDVQIITGPIICNNKFLRYEGKRLTATGTVVEWYPVEKHISKRYDLAGKRNPINEDPKDDQFRKKRENRSVDTLHVAIRGAAWYPTGRLRQPKDG